MKFHENSFVSHNNTNIYYYSWMPESKPKAIIQVSHGMCEKALRYSYVAEELVKNGYGVYINDHLGHGKTANNEYGYMGKGDGFLMMVSDMNKLTDIIKQNHPESKIFLLGHSMGSFLALRYIQLYSNKLAGVIFSGTGGYDQVSSSQVGSSVAKVSMDLFGPKRKAILIEKITKKKFNKRIDKVVTGNEWLSRDIDALKDFGKGCDTGFIFTSSAYYYMFKGMIENFNDSNMRAIPKNLKIYLFSGDEDPVGNYGEGVKYMYDLYKNKLEISDVTLRLYNHGRHEMLNEINKDEVIEHLIDWLNKRI